MSASGELKSAPTSFPAAASTYISLSTQCDRLYRVGALPHSFASISEQSVYTRAVEQLRFATPSPDLLLSVGRCATLSDSPVPCERDVDNVDHWLPHVYMSADPPHPFPSIERFEAARRAALEEEEKKRAKAHQQFSAAPKVESGDRAAPTLAPHDGLVPSGPLLAKSTFRHDYEDHRRKAPIGASVAAAAASCGGTTDQPVGSFFKDSSQTPSPSPQLIFPSPVLLRAVVQHVLTLQSSTSNSAARLLLAQYRGVQLIPWHTILDGEPRPATLSTQRLSLEAAVISVLPQVLADRVASCTRTTSGAATTPLSPEEEKRHTTLYALTPFTGPPSGVGTRGLKRPRETSQSAQHEGPAVYESSAAISAGAVRCERLLTTSEAFVAQIVQVRYAAVSADKFEGWLPQTRKRDASSQTTSEAAPCVAETLLYEEESAWMTDGVFNPLFSLPRQPPVEVAVATGADASNAEEGSSGRENTAHLTFIKTSAFLYLTFLVHRSWCAHVHSAVAQALAAHRLPSRAEKHTGSLGLVSSGTHVTCLPPAEEARRSPQYEWRSALVYRLHEKRAAGCTTSGTSGRLGGNEGVCGVGIGNATAVDSLRHGRDAWQLTILIVNRSAQLQWWMRNSSPATCVREDSVAIKSSCTDPEGLLNGSGTLDDFLQQL
ncbi:hypothetical protein JKF63_01728 [Porcisia hertigi]|uniref:Uncharacterized protein n=1 Tax=Porcisia hertigi TaxID=2761500 RepID=A0A836L0C9_9TRYP|nr:hypothetical protein JKF63_01728 [Porcisia hertigi]